MDISELMRLVKKMQTPAEEIVKQVNMRIEEADPNDQEALKEIDNMEPFEGAEPFLTGVFLNERMKKVFSARSTRYNELLKEHLDFLAKKRDSDATFPTDDGIYSMLDDELWKWVRAEFFKYHNFNPKWIGIRKNWEIAIPRSEADEMFKNKTVN